MQDSKLLEYLRTKWPVLKYSDVIQDVSGGNKKIKSADFLEEGPYPIIDQGAELIGGYTSDENALVNESGPLIVFGDHTRTFKYVDFRFAMGADGIKVLKAKNVETSDPRYLYYFFKSLELPNDGYSRHYKYVKSLLIPLPPLPTQRRIAAALDLADRQRQLLRAEIAAYGELGESLFLEMFGDSRVNPYGLVSKPLTEVTTKIVDCPHSTPTYVEGPTDYPCIRTTELKNGTINWSKMKYLDENGYAERTKRLVPKEGDVIYGREGTFGDAVLVPADVRMSLGQRVMLFRPNLDLINPQYFLAAIRSKGTYHQALRVTAGSTVGHVNIKDIKRFEILVPPILNQIQFSNRIQKIEALKAQAETALAEADDLFNGLLQRAFSGTLFAEGDRGELLGAEAVTADRK